MQVARPDDGAVAELFTRRATALGLPDDAELSVRELGVGEAHVNLLVRAAGEKYVLRISLRDDAAKMAYEFAVLGVLPDGLGPSPLVLDTSRAVIPYPCAVLSYVDGEIIRHWSRARIRSHAATLARLHGVEREYAGPVDAESGGRLDIVFRFDESLRYWQARHPELLEAPDVAALIPPLRAYLEQRRPVIDAIERYSLIHGDAGMTNTLFAGDTVRYIDWELAEFGDPALDLAMLAWDIDNPPWQMRFGRQELAAFMEEYRSHRRDETLPERHQVWVTFTKFFDHLYFRFRASSPRLEPGSLTADDYARTVERIVVSLRKQLL